MQKKNPFCDGRHNSAGQVYITCLQNMAMYCNARVNFITRIICKAKSYKFDNYNPMHFAPGDTLYNFD